MNSKEKARDAALRKLASHMRTEKEIRDHLKSLDFSPLFSLLCSILISSDKHCEIMVEIATILF